MSEDPSLFGDDEPEVAPDPLHEPATIADWQIALLRRALDARGLTSMAERQLVIERAVGRAVESLRGLTHEEAISALSSLGQQPTAGRAQKSTWDDREEDTWIDRL